MLRTFWSGIRGRAVARRMEELRQWMVRGGADSCGRDVVQAPTCDGQHFTDEVATRRDGFSGKSLGNENTEGENVDEQNARGAAANEGFAVSTPAEVEGALAKQRSGRSAGPAGVPMNLLNIGRCGPETGTGRPLHGPLAGRRRSGLEGREGQLA